MLDNIARLLRNKTIDYVIILLVFILTYWRVTNIFFIQDEWRVFGLILSEDWSFVVRGLFDSNVFHFIPINLLIEITLFKIFSLNYVGYNLIGLFFHVINSILIFKIVYRLLKSHLYSLLTSLLFITSTVSSQLIMWPMISISTLSLTFTLITINYLIDLIESPSRVSSLLLTLSTLGAVLTVEYAAGLFIFVPITVFSSMRNIRKAIMSLKLFLSLGVVYLLVRIYPFVIDLHGVSGSPSKSSFQHLLSLSQLPLQYFTQVFIPQDLLISVIKKVIFNDYLVENTYFPIINSLIAFIILLIVLVLFFKERNQIQRDLFIFLNGIFFIFCSAFPFILLSGIGISYNIIPPRYLYFGSAAVALLLVMIVKFIINKKNLYLGCLIILVVLSFLGYGLVKNNIYANQLYYEGQLRLSILNKIRNSYPSLPEKVIFYTESDKSYYGLTDRIMPFQSGFGQNLMVWYSVDDKKYIPFLKDKFLWEIKDQGYQESNGIGFGYYRDKFLLRGAIAQSNLLENSIIAFKYMSLNNNLEDITSPLRAEISDRNK